MAQDNSKSETLGRLNRDRNWSDLRGYPSDKQYMKHVSEAGDEKQQNKLSADADKAQAKVSGRKKTARKRG